MNFFQAFEKDGFGYDDHKQIAGGTAQGFQGI
jgi:hypothetical protein